LLKLIPLTAFKEQKINPQVGLVLNIDDAKGIVRSVSGGRVIVDFNHPLAGKEVIYKIKILKKLEKIDDKINALNEFLFKKKFDFEIQDKKLILNVEKQLAKFVELFKDKFKEVFDLDLEVKAIEESKPEFEENGVRFVYLTELLDKK